MDKSLEDRPAPQGPFTSDTLETLKPTLTPIRKNKQLDFYNIIITTHNYFSSLIRTSPPFSPKEWSSLNIHFMFAVSGLLSSGAAGCKRDSRLNLGLSNLPARCPLSFNHKRTHGPAPPSAPATQQQQQQQSSSSRSACWAPPSPWRHQGPYHSAM